MLTYNICELILDKHNILWYGACVIDFCARFQRDLQAPYTAEKVVELHGGTSSCIAHVVTRVLCHFVDYMRLVEFVCKR